MDTNNRAFEMLEATRAIPRMYASNRESLLQRVATIIEMINDGFVPTQFYAKHLGLDGPEFCNPQGRFDDALARKVCEDAMTIVNPNWNTP